MDAPESVRIDKWLWAVRVFKSRTLAADACCAGKIRIAGQPVKASRNVRVGEVITAVTGDVTRTIEVIGLLERRVGAARVPEFAKEHTPVSEFQKRREPNLLPPVFRPKGSGRPTKKQRREIEGWTGS